MEAQSNPPHEDRSEVPRVGQLILLHVPGRPAPIDATVTHVAQHVSRPPSLSVRVNVPGMGPTNLVSIEHVSQGHPFAGWEMPK
jgi:hypothetical protein